MSAQQPYPTGPTPPTAGPPAPQPPSVALAVKLIWAAIAITVLTTVVSFVNLDASVELALESDTTGTLTESSARSAIIGFTLAFLVVGVGLYALLAIFIGKGKNWARITYTVLGVLFVLLGVLNLGAEQSALELILGLLRTLLTVATLVLLFRKDANPYFAGR